MVIPQCAGAAPVLPRPHIARQGGNLVPNASARTASTWSLIGDAVYDAAESRTSDGSGSIRLMTPYYDADGGYVEESGRAHSDYMPIAGGGRHTLAFYAKTNSGPTYVTAMVSIHDANRGFLRNLPGGRYGTTKDGVWQECVLPVFIPEEAVYVRVAAVKMADTRPGGQVWVDDFYFGTGVGFERPPAAKRAFNGSHVRVDGLGNFEIVRSGEWTPFFPLCIYSDNHRDPSVYSRQGWNTIIWTSAVSQVQAAKDAVSDFNPDGMLAGFQLAQYTFPAGWAYGDVDDLRTQLDRIFAAGLAENLLLYYWDNENSYDQWDVPARVIAAVDSIDADATGGRRRPVYALQGNYGIARVHASRGMADVSGTYVGGGADATGGAGSGDFDGLLVLDQLEGQTTPAAFAQFNGVTGPGDMRLRLYSAILLGAKGMGYWRDCYQGCGDGFQASVGPVDSKEWWPDFPTLRSEVDALLPLIRQPHWTAWSVEADPANAVRVGGRDLDGDGHLILVNQTSEAQTVTLTVAGMAYAAVAAVDYFSGREIANVVDGSFVVHLPAIGIGSGTQVMRLASSRQEDGVSGDYPGQQRGR